MTPAQDITAEHQRMRDFMIAATKIFDHVHDFQLRSWALKYALYVRDARGCGVRGLVPPETSDQFDLLQVAYIIGSIDASATSVFGPENL
jgi:hypothetical protein